jgi:ABC-type sugar transport system ATPase subunit
LSIHFALLRSLRFLLLKKSSVTPRLQTIALRKEYPGTVALDDVSLSFGGGQVHALVGKNGAGKSTLVKIFAGSVQPTSGRLFVDGREVRLRSPIDAFRQGIATVHQELSLVPELTIGENILLGRLPMRRRFGLSRIDWPAVYREAQRLLEALNTGLDARRRVRELSVAQQQVVEIAKAFSFEPSVLMLDEPTSALSRHETASLFRLIRQLTGRGVAVLYITHRLQELAEIADTVTVLRDGQMVSSGPMSKTGTRAIVQLMFGEVVQRYRPADLVPGTEPLLEVRGLTRGRDFQNISFTLHRGEILGLAGQLGSGRTELLRAIFGAEPPDDGEVVIEGRALRPTDPPTMRALGIALTPENRKEQGLVPGLGIRPNFFMASLDRMSRRGVVSVARERTRAQQLIANLSIHTPNLESPVASLSGGNQQKVVIGKWLNRDPRVILFDEPTRGVDLAAKQQIFQVMWDLSRRGLGCVFVSSELEELLEVCHRILILKEGRLIGETKPGETTINDLAVRCMTA